MPTLPEGVWILVDGERVLPQGIDQFLVASKSETGATHNVEWDEESLDWTCTCMSYQCRRRCRHSRAISRFKGNVADVRIAVDKEDDETP